MADGEGAGSNAIWALAFIIVVAIIMGALYYSGFLSGKKTPQTDVEISVPTR